MKPIERLAGNSFYLFLDALTTTLLSFIFWVIIWKTLPPSSAGIIATSINMMILLSVFSSFGLQTVLVKLVSEYSGSILRIKSLLNFSYRIILGASVAISIGFISFAAFSGIDLKIPISASLLITLGVVIWPMAQATHGILEGFQNMRRLFRTNFVSHLVKTSLAAALIFLGFDFIGPVAATVISLAVLLVLRSDILILGLRVKNAIDKKKVILKYASPAFISGIGLALFVNTPVIILTLFDSLHSSGIFAAALSMANPMVFIPTIITAALFPIVSSLMVKKHHAKVQANLLKSAIRYTAFFTLPLLALYLFFAKGFVLVFASLNYLEAVQFLPVMVTAIVLYGFGWLFVSSLYAIRKTEANRNIVLATAAAFLVLSIPLTILFGIVGLVAAYFISVLVLLFLSYSMLRRHITLEIPWSAVGKVALASAILYLIMLPSELADLRFLERLQLLFVGLVVYFVVLGRTKFYTEEDLTVLNFAKRRVPSLRGVIARIEKFIKGNISD